MLATARPSCNTFATTRSVLCAYLWLPVSPCAYLPYRWRNSLVTKTSHIDQYIRLGIIHCQNRRGSPVPPRDPYSCFFGRRPTSPVIIRRGGHALMWNVNCGSGWPIHLSRLIRVSAPFYVNHISPCSVYISGGSIWLSNADSDSQWNRGFRFVNGMDCFTESETGFPMDPKPDSVSNTPIVLFFVNSTECRPTYFI